MDRIAGPGAPSARRAPLRVAARDGEVVEPQSDDASLDALMAAVMTDCLDRFETYAPKLREKTSAAEAVHQMRVSLRRLRVFLGILGGRVPATCLAEAAERAKTLAHALGPARDWHVFRGRLQPDVQAPQATAAGYCALRDAVELRSGQALAQARAAVASPLARRFVSELREAIASRSWRDSAEGLFEAGSARPFAAEILERLHRRASKRCGDVAGVSAKRRHRARIAAKRARYAGEFFGPLFGDGAADYLRILEKIQERLGESNDVEIAAGLLSEIESSGQVPDATINDLRQSLAKARRKGRAALKRVEERAGALEPFWR